MKRFKLYALLFISCLSLASCQFFTNKGSAKAECVCGHGDACACPVGCICACND